MGQQPKSNLQKRKSTPAWCCALMLCLLASVSGCYVGPNRLLPKFKRTAPIHDHTKNPHILNEDCDARQQETPVYNETRWRVLETSM